MFWIIYFVYWILSSSRSRFSINAIFCTRVLFLLLISDITTVNDMRINITDPISIANNPLDGTSIPNKDVANINNFGNKAIIKKKIPQKIHSKLYFNASFLFFNNIVNITK